MMRALHTTSTSCSSSRPTPAGRLAPGVALKLALGLTALGLALAVAGCGGSPPSSAGTTGTAGVAAAESAAASAAANGSDDSNGSGAKALFSDDEACAWLKSNMKKIRAASGDVDAQLVLTLGLSSFFEKHGGLEHADGFAFDQATSRGCKAEHDEAITKAGIKSMGNL